MGKVVKLRERQRARNGKLPLAKPTRTEAENAVRTLIRWAGDDPDREGLQATPSRVAPGSRVGFVPHALAVSAVPARQLAGSLGRGRR